MKEILKYIQLYTGCNDHALKRIEALLEPKLQLSVVEKIIYVKKKPKLGKSLLEWSEQYYKDNKVTYEFLSQRFSSREIVAIRNAYIKEAYFQGFTASEIGRHLKRDHSTILNSVNK
jgi:hypothetical protein